jgi:hypothetical protein
MRTIMLPLCTADLAEAMAATRCWLDHHRVQPSIFTCEAVGEGILTIKLAFALGAEAEAFAEAFGGRQADDPIPLWQAAPAAPPPLRRLMPACSQARRRQWLELCQKPKALCWW